MRAEECTDSEIGELHDRHRGAKLEILHTSNDGAGTVAVVYEVDGVRRYRAMEYTQDYGEDADPDDIEDSWVQAYGYDTENKHHYMGQRYQGLDWGPYRYEVFYSVEHTGKYHMIEATTGQVVELGQIVKTQGGHEVVVTSITADGKCTIQPPNGGHFVEAIPAAINVRIVEG